jgi:hypothetical protein
LVSRLTVPHVSVSPYALSSVSFQTARKETKGPRTPGLTQCWMCAATSLWDEEGEEDPTMEASAHCSPVPHTEQIPIHPHHGTAVPWEASPRPQVTTTCEFASFLIYI